MQDCFFSQNPIYYSILFSWILLAIIIFPLLLKITPKYGRHSVNKGIMIDNKLGWILMELPTIILMPIFFTTGVISLNITTFIFLSLYMIHYIHRTLIFPFRIKTKGKKNPIQIIIYAIIFNVINTFFIGYYFGNIGEYTMEWLQTPNFIIGCIIFAIGMLINLKADSTLINLRKESLEYKIPNGILFNYISCPNHFGEMIEWVGFAILTWSWPGLAFSLWTIANLLPRSISHHKWYKHKFSNYPKKRKAVFPFII